MRVNVDKVLERDQKLSELDDRAGESLHLVRHRQINNKTQYNVWTIEFTSEHFPLCNLNKFTQFIVFSFEINKLCYFASNLVNIKF